jgi:hypothetical protein
MTKKLLLICVVTALFLVTGCSNPSGQPSAPGVSDALNESADPANRIPGLETKTPESLGGVCLGDSLEKVTSVLGQAYTETLITDEAGYIGEDMIELMFESGITVTLGKESGEVIRVVSQSPGFETYLGIEVGDEAKTALDKYRSTYKEVVSRHSNNTLPGWFNVGQEIIVIFDFDREDETRVNDDIMPNSVVQEIVLAYWKHFD